MSETRITYYLGTRYQVTTQCGPTGRFRNHHGTVWRNILISQPGSAGGPYAGDLDLAGLWQEFMPADYYSRKYEFREYLRSMVTDPRAIAAITFCAHCGDPAWDDVLESGICEPCRDEYYSHCDSCGELTRTDDGTMTLAESWVCDSCLRGYYTYCDDCDGYYPDRDAGEHEHYAGSDCCESPQQVFTVRNDGCPPLANDTRAQFTLPAGTISPAGIRAIRDYLLSAGHTALYYSLDAIGDQWQTREGNFAKRLSRHAYKVHQAKVTPETMSQIGCIARDHSNAVSVEIEVTRDFNQSAAFFYHDESCYWGSYSESRCALKTNGAYAMRSFSDGELSGRAWVIPLRLNPWGKLAPTFATLDADASVVFNGYGDLGGYAAARIVAHMAGQTYRKIGFDCTSAYINAGGYLVAPEHIAAQYTDGSLHLSLCQHSDLYEREMQS